MGHVFTPNIFIRSAFHFHKPKPNEQSENVGKLRFGGKIVNVTRLPKKSMYRIKNGIFWCKSEGDSISVDVAREGREVVALVFSLYFPRGKFDGLRLAIWTVLGTQIQNGAEAINIQSFRKQSRLYRKYFFNYTRSVLITLRKRT